MGTMKLLPILLIGAHWHPILPSTPCLWSSHPAVLKNNELVDSSQKPFPSLLVVVLDLTTAVPALLVVSFAMF